MTRMLRTLLDQWKEEKYLRHHTIVHVLGTINWRWFEREGERENQANHKILLVTTYEKKEGGERERERFAVSNVPIVSSNAFARAKMYWIRSPPWSYITCSLINSFPLSLSLSSFFFLFLFPSRSVFFHLIWHKAWILRNSSEEKK